MGANQSQMIDLLTSTHETVKRASGNASGSADISASSPQHPGFDEAMSLDLANICEQLNKDLARAKQDVDTSFNRLFIGQRYLQQQAAVDMKGRTGAMEPRP